MTAPAGRAYRECMTRAWLSILSWLALAGCSAIVSPDPSRLGGSDAEPQSPDSGVRRTDGGYDASSPRPDAGPLCVMGSRCEGEILVTCGPSGETRRNCTDEGAFCAGDRCQPWVCVPGSRTCSEDGTGVIACTTRGDMETRMPCESGCDPMRNDCRTTPPACAGLPRITLGGSQRVDLCAESDDATYRPTPEGCPANRSANVGDRTFVLTLDEETDVVIDLRDDDGVAIDTVVYVRTACDDPESQIACDDDVPCSETDVPGLCIGSQVRQSTIRRRLPAGTYYIVVDAFQYSYLGTEYRCGQVLLSVTEP